MLQRIVEYVRKQGGRVSTPDIIAAFGQEVGAGESTLFKSLLKEACTRTREVKRGKRIGVWTLKPDFVDDS